MEIVPVPVGALHASSRCELRSHRIGRVKFVGLPLEMDPGVALRGQRAPGVVARIVSRVIGCLVAARP
ncbi:MAG TPA: hypothetical protein VF287_02375 [Usitatibacter sp.]|jgi:hypothetical protein